MSKDALRNRFSWEFTFCCFFSSQTGVIIISFHGLTLMCVILLCNMFGRNDEDKLIRIVAQYTVLVSFLIIMSLGYVLMFISVYRYSVNFAKAGLTFLSIGTLLYLILTVASFVPSSNVRRTVCVSYRCPDVLWLQRAGWRDIVYEKEFKGRGNSIYILVSFFVTLMTLGSFGYTLYTCCGFFAYVKRKTGNNYIK